MVVAVIGDWAGGIADESGGFGDIVGVPDLGGDGGLLGTIGTTIGTATGGFFGGDVGAAAGTDDADAGTWWDGIGDVLATITDPLPPDLLGPASILDGGGSLVEGVPDWDGGGGIFGGLFGVLAGGGDVGYQICTSEGPHDYFTVEEMIGLPMVVVDSVTTTIGDADGWGGALASAPDDFDADDGSGIFGGLLDVFETEAEPAAQPGMFDQIDQIDADEIGGILPDDSGDDDGLGLDLDLATPGLDPALDLGAATELQPGDLITAAAFDDPAFDGDGSSATDLDGDASFSLSPPMGADPLDDVDILVALDDGPSELEHSFDAADDVESSLDDLFGDVS